MLIGRNNYSRSCANKLGGGWEREKVQRAAKRYDEGDGHSKVIGLRLLLLAAVIMAAKSAPPTNEHMSNDKETIVYVRGDYACSSASCKPGWMRSSNLLSACYTLKLRV